MALIPIDNGDTGLESRNKINSSFLDIALNAPLAGNNTFTGNNTFEGGVTFEDNVQVDKIFGCMLAGTTISSGAITQTSSNMAVSAESAAPDNLDTINTTGSDGDILILRKTVETITVTEVGNITLGDTTRVLNASTDRLMLQYDGTNWVELSYSDNA